MSATHWGTVSHWERERERERRLEREWEREGALYPVVIRMTVLWEITVSGREREREGVSVRVGGGPVTVGGLQSRLSVKISERERERGSVRRGDAVWTVSVHPVQW